jgi:hypothetical protein
MSGFVGAYEVALGEAIKSLHEDNVPHDIIQKMVDFANGKKEQARTLIGPEEVKRK